MERPIIDVFIIHDMQLKQYKSPSPPYKVEQSGCASKVSSLLQREGRRDLKYVISYQMLSSSASQQPAMDAWRIYRKVQLDLPLSNLSPTTSAQPETERSGAPPKLYTGEERLRCGTRSLRTENQVRLSRCSAAHRCCSMRSKEHNFSNPLNDAKHEKHEHGKFQSPIR